MRDIYLRTSLLVGDKGTRALEKASVLVVGAGGVGSYTIEALSRAGIGRIGICDADTVSPTNLNRQLYALNSTLGKKKVEVAKMRILDINPYAVVDEYPFFYDDTTQDKIPLAEYDYIVDAIDTMDSKINLIVRANNLGVKIISALSAGNKLNPYMFEAADIYSTSVCPIAKILRKRLREENVLSHKVIYSKEPSKKIRDAEIFDGGKSNVGSISYVPSVMGLLLAGEVIADIIERE